MIALDMDGTVLNDEKQIDKETKEAIQDALTAGVEVVFCTGRSLAEMRDILVQFPNMNYLCGESGALVVDLKNGKILHRDEIDRQTSELLMEASQRKDVMVCTFSEGVCWVKRECMLRMDHYQMEPYQKIYEKICRTLESDVLETLLEENRPIEKINLYHTGRQERLETRKWLAGQQIKAEMVDSEMSSLECSPLGVSKATGLKNLCAKLGIELEQVVMVGDADNDIEAMKVAGLAVAMGNANEHVKKICDLEVADNNHQGCAQAIRHVVFGGEND
mgnify:FL=1